MKTAWVTKVPACLAAASAAVYFAASDGIRNHLLLLRQALAAIADHLR